MLLDESADGLDVEVHEVCVVDVVLGVGLEEVLLLFQSQGQSLEGFVEFLAQLVPLVLRATLEILFEMEEVLDVIDLFFLEVLVEDPDAVLEEGEMGDLVGLQVEAEP